MTPVQSVADLIAAETARTGIRRAVSMRGFDDERSEQEPRPSSIPTPPSMPTPPPPSSTRAPLSVTPQPVPTVPPIAVAPFAPPSLEDAERILRGDYHPRAKVPSVRTVDDSFLARLREGEPFIVGTVAFFGALLVAGIVFIVISLAAAH